MASVNPVTLCSPASEFGGYDYYDRVREEVALLVEQGEGFVENPSVIPVNLAPCLEVDDAATSNVFRSGVVPTASSTTTTIHLRHLSLFVPLTFLPGPSDPEDTLDVISAMYLAIHEWNNELSDITPEAAEISRQCPVKFTMDILDTRWSNKRSVRLLWERVLKRIDKEDDPVDTPEEAHRIREPASTAVLSSNLSRDTGPMSVLASATVMPIFSMISQATPFENRDQYPYFGRTVPSFRVSAVMIAEFYKYVLGSDHVAVLVQRDAFGTSLLTEFVEACKSLNLKTTSASFATGRDYEIAAVVGGEAARRRIREKDYTSLRPLCELGLRHFFMVFYDWPTDRVMEVAAERFGGTCTGPGTFWMKSDTFTFPSGTYEAGSLFAEALEHMATLSFPRTPEEVADRASYKAFTSKYWPEGVRNDPNFNKYMTSKMPATYFEVGLPNVTVPYRNLVNAYAMPAYDLVTSIALSACGVERRRVEGDPLDTDGASLFDAFIKLRFEGLSGTVAFDSNTGGREKGSFPYVIVNVVPNEPVNGTVTFRREPVYIYTEATENSTSGWTLINEDSKFLYADGTKIPPRAYPQLEVEYLAVHPLTAMFCGLLAALVMVASICFVGWTLRSSRRGCRVVQASQPVFLVLLCAGTFIMASSIIPFSIIYATVLSGDDDDGTEGYSVHEPELNVACMTTPWLFSLGFLMIFSSLFTKLMRINKIFQAGSFRRSRVLARDVSRPFTIFLFAQVIILIAWTVIAPLRYRLVATGATDRYGRLTKRYPTCYPEFRTANLQDHIFWMLLFLLNFCAVLWANREAYTARNVPSQFSESYYIGWGMGSILEAFLIGGPMLTVARREPNAMLMTSSILVVILSLAILSLMFFPKINFQKTSDSLQPQNPLRRGGDMSSWQTSLSDASFNRPNSSRRCSGGSED